jgi:soluble lytic murein transglycosylase-like protein
MAFFKRLRQSTALLVGDTLRGARMFFLNTFVITGLFVAGAIFLIYSQPDLRYFGKVVLINLIRNESGIPADPAASNRATYLEPSSLSAPEYRVATWISKRYRVALEPVSALVKVAFVEGEREQIDPALILAVMCIESGVHPYAQSPVGADGLMQVMTTINAKMYERYGGTTAAYDPVTNLRVGIQILKMLIKRRGSVEEALKFYVGAGISGEDGGYVAKVLQEQVLIQQTMLRPVN